MDERKTTLMVRAGEEQHALHIAYLYRQAGYGDGRRTKLRDCVVYGRPTYQTFYAWGDDNHVRVKQAP